MLIRVLVLGILCGFFNSAFASSFKVFPLKLNFNETSKTALFRITNTDTVPVTVQLSSAIWNQNEEGEDEYQKTNDIIFFPKIVEVNRDEERIVRVAYRGNAATQHEKSYRLFAQELPSKAEANTALSFALRFSVPIFITKNRMSYRPKLETAYNKHGNAFLDVLNTGSKHLVVTSINAEGFASDGGKIFETQSKGWYVLPNKRKPFAVALPEMECLKAKTIRMEVEIERRKYEKRFNVDAAQCAPLKTVHNN